MPFWDSDAPAPAPASTGASTQQAAYTQAHAMSRDNFLKKYGQTFKADDKGGNAASEVAGGDTGAYYDKFLAPGASQTMSVAHGWDSAPTQEKISWGEGKYADAHPYFDGYDNVNPHPESQKGNGWDEAWKQIGRPIATGALMYTGVGALAEMMGGAAAAGAAAGAGTAGSAGIGSGTVLGGGAATGATSASGLAGYLGMNAGYGATALNSGVLNTGMSLARGNNIGDALKSGVTSAFLSPISTYVGDAAGGGLVGQVAGSTASGGVQGLINGQGFGKGLGTGLTNGLVGAAGSYMGGMTKDATGSDFAGSAADTLTKSALRGNLNGATLDSLATQYLSGQLTDLTGLPPGVASSVLSLARGKKLNPGALTQLAVGSAGLQKTVQSGAVGSGPLTQTAS